MEQLLAWLENHKVTTDLIKWVILLFIAWGTGLFKVIRRFNMRPSLKIVPTASFAYIEEFENYTDQHNNLLKNTFRISYILNVSLINRSTEKIVLDEFKLSFKTISFFRSYKQELLRIMFPNRPRKRVGESQKYMGVWFTQFPLEELNIETITGEL